MMAARALAAVGGEGRGDVSACESYLPMGKLARRVLRANGMQNQVKVFHKRSDELRVGVDLDSRADILVTLLLSLFLLAALCLHRVLFWSGSKNAIHIK